jgi:glyoxylase-like metal-dependent hydrolase (beta-lactamase superfamily II)
MQRWPGRLPSTWPYKRAKNNFGTAMTVQIHPISFGFVSVFLLKGKKTVLIDAGVPGQIERFLDGLAMTGTQPDEIDLLLLTHGHFDHIGLAKEIVDLSGAQTAIHTREKEWLETGKSPLPPGVTPWGKFLISLMKLAPRMSVQGTWVDIVLGNEGFSLEEYDIPAQVVYTPGHTMGSMSILLENGDAVVGDLAMSARYLRLSPGIPIFAEDVSLIKPSWKKLLDMGARKIYPAHGKPFSAEVFHKQIG